MRQALLPEGWKRPKGYSNGIKASGTLLFTAGVIGWNALEEFESESLVDQFRQVLINTREVLAAGGARPENVVRMTWFVTDMEAYTSNLRAIGQIWREEFGAVYPCIACIGVSTLVEPLAKVEIETTAVITECD